MSILRLFTHELSLLLRMEALVGQIGLVTYSSSVARWYRACLNRLRKWYDDESLKAPTKAAEEPVTGVSSISKKNPEHVEVYTVSI